MEKPNVEVWLHEALGAAKQSGPRAEARTNNDSCCGPARQVGNTPRLN
jgi:hypothetical protein